MANVYIDRVDNLSIVERHGALRSLNRKIRINFQPVDNKPYDYSALTLALSFCNELGLTPFSTLAKEGYEALVLVERHPGVIHNDPNWVDVELKYEHILDGPNQILTPGFGANPNLPPLKGIIYGKGRASISEKATNFYWPPGVERIPQNREQILVAHTFPTWETGIAAVPTDPTLPRTIIQGGEINVPFPQRNFQCQGIINTDTPQQVCDQFIRCINVNNWLGQPPLTWICSEVTFEMISNPVVFLNTTYKFTFEFQYNEDTWDPTVVFNDQRTGRPPADVEAATLEDPNGVENLVINPYSNEVQPAGYWTVPFLPRVDFTQLFQQNFES
jgi:hypothetical protein